MYVYRISNTLNGKVYIGKTELSVAKRWKQHVKNAQRGMPQFLYCAIRKYGKASFVVEQISQHETADELCIAEIASIYIHKSSDPAYGYNMTDGGEGVCGLKWSAASRARLSKSQTGKKRLFTDEHRRALSKAMLKSGRKPSRADCLAGASALRDKYKSGYRLPPEVRAKIIEGRRKAGYIVTFEARLKQRLAKLGKKRGPHSESHNTALKLSWTPERKSKMAEMSTGNTWATGNTNRLGTKQDDAALAKIKEAALRNWADPEYRAKISLVQKEATRNSWQDPVARANRIAGLKKAWERRKQVTQLPPT